MTSEENSGGGDGVFAEVKGLKKSIGEQVILNGVDLEIRKGETLALIGQSGEGKSVFLKHLMGLMKPDSGTVLVGGAEVCGLPERALGEVRKKFGILFQNGALFDSMNVLENVGFPLREHGERDLDLIDERALESLDVVGLREHAEKMPINLSGGMRKRVALARAVITRPECILYDEPTAGLDPVVSDSIDHLIRRLQRRFRVTSVVVSHDMKSVYYIADRVAYLRGGKIFFLGTPEELRASENEVVQNFIHGRSGESGESPA